MIAVRDSAQLRSTWRYPNIVRASIHALLMPRNIIAPGAESRPPHNASRAPTSALLEALLDDAPPDFVTLAWLMDKLRERSFGIVMLLLALVALLPGTSPFIGVLLVILAFQMILARHSPVLPRFVATHPLSTRRLARLVHRAIPLLQRAEKIIHPRWRTPFVATKRAVGCVLLVLGATLLAPIPFSHIIPALTIMLVSFAYLEEDGALLCLALVMALASAAISAAQVWATALAANHLGWF
jgi:hypothetical protein